MGRHVRVQQASACGCIHIDGIWVTPTQERCPIHPCTLCTMHAVDHMAHVLTRIDVPAPCPMMTPEATPCLLQLDHVGPHLFGYIRTPHT